MQRAEYKDDTKAISAAEWPVPRLREVHQMRSCNEGGADLAVRSRDIGSEPGVQESCTIRRGCPVPTETTYTSLRENLASVLDQVVDQQETVIVRRRGDRDVALVPASELAGLIETAHLLRSPRNARRLLAALRRAERGKQKPATIAELRREMLGATGS